MSDAAYTEIHSDILGKKKSKIDSFFSDFFLLQFGRLENLEKHEFEKGRSFIRNLAVDVTNKPKILSLPSRPLARRDCSKAQNFILAAMAIS